MAKGDPLNITCGKLHDHLGTILDYIQKGKVKVDMIQYLKPVENHLFDVNNSATFLSEEYISLFHTIFYKLLFTYKRARPDIQMTIAFLITRISAPDEDGYKKLI